LFLWAGLIGLSYSAVERGKDFVESKSPVPIIPGKIEVIEFFSIAVPAATKCSLT